MLVVDTVIKVGIASFAIKLLIDYIFRKIEKLKEETKSMSYNGWYSGSVVKTKI